jgi:hypothetical protein
MGKKEKKQFLVGVFDNESKLISAIDTLRAKGVTIHDVYTPYPVHELDVHLGFKRTRLAKAAFLFGITGTTLAITMQTYMLGFAWPMIIGGKDYIAVPDFVPVTFELTVLCASLGMVGTFLISNGLGPGKKARMFDPRSTDDKYVMAIELGKNSKFTKEELIQMLKDNGVSEEPTIKEF